jgi:hypothetical protein
VWGKSDDQIEKNPDKMVIKEDDSVKKSNIFDGKLEFFP